MFRQHPWIYLHKYFIPLCWNNDSLLTSTQLDHTKCISWRQTGGCDPNGPREPQFDKPCDAYIPHGASGYCECDGGIKQMMKACSKGKFSSCNAACKNGKFLTRSIFVVYHKWKYITRGF